jgi:hypothetical protein
MQFRVVLVPKATIRNVIIKRQSPEAGGMISTINGGDR